MNDVSAVVNYIGASDSERGGLTDFFWSLCTQEYKGDHYLDELGYGTELC